MIIVLIILTCSFIAGALIIRFDRSKSDHTIDLRNPDVLLKVWLSDVAARETKEGLHQHIVKHAKELFGEVEETGTYESWSASMHNLLSIYDEFHGILPDTDLQLERMTAKYISNPNEGTTPPAPIPVKIVAGARGPSIEVRKAEKKKQKHIQDEVKRYYHGGS